MMVGAQVYVKRAGGHSGSKWVATLLAAANLTTFFQYGVLAAMRSTCDTYCRSTSDGPSVGMNHGPAVSPSAVSTAPSVRSNAPCPPVPPLSGCHTARQ